jgi:hypothetical protein
MSEMDARRVELYLRHIHEGGAKIAEFLKAHPDIDPDFIEDMTDKEETELQQYSSDLAITQQIERDELDAKQYGSSRPAGIHRYAFSAVTSLLHPIIRYPEYSESDPLRGGIK